MTHRPLDPRYVGGSPHVTPEFNAVINDITKPENVAKRRFVGYVRCFMCGHVRGKKVAAKAYKGDPRARSWLRCECPFGHWYDLDPKRAVILKKVRQR